MKIIKNNSKRMQSIDEECTVATNPAFNKMVAMKCMGVLLPLVKNRTAVGLACNQIGYSNARVFLAVVNNKIKIFINPFITKKEGKLIMAGLISVIKLFSLRLNLNYNND